MNETLNYFLFETKHVNAALQELLAIGLSEYSIIEDSETSTYTIGGLLSSDANLSKITLATYKEAEPDLWLKQWELFAPHFHNGLCHIHLEEYGGPAIMFKMQPGPGFGDLSHDTTQLCLSFLCKMNLQGKTVIDIGCGSGVLSIGALKLGCKGVISIDIDQEAIVHAKQNFLLNNLSSSNVSTTLPDSLPENPIILMNMTYLEQIQVLNSYPILSQIGAEWIISGLLNTQIKEYQKSCPFLSIKKKELSKPWIGLYCQSVTR